MIPPIPPIPPIRKEDSHGFAELASDGGLVWTYIREGDLHGAFVLPELVARGNHDRAGHSRQLALQVVDALLLHLQEMGHGPSSWTHAICEGCWISREGERLPVRLRQPRPLKLCCWCGRPHRSGIFMRADPTELPRCPHHAQAQAVPS